jgi:hypothetical protein
MNNQDDYKYRTRRSFREWLHGKLTYCTLDQACGREPLHLYQRFFRWLGWP